MDQPNQESSLYEDLAIGLDPRTIRLLSINPCCDEDDLEARLEVAELKEGMVYTAVSYTWGDSYVYGHIKVNGHRVRIGENLAVLLRHLFNEEKAKYKGKE